MKNGSRKAGAQRAAEVGSARTAEKKAYATPTLRRLGSVRDLTLGTFTTGNPDGRGGGQMGPGPGTGTGH